MDLIFMVNKQFTNAVHIMVSLALLKNNKADQNLILNSEQLAQTANTNPVVIRRLISSLAKLGLIKTSRGKSGGVILAKDPSVITLKDIYLSLELSDAINCDEKPAHKDCPVSCAMHMMMAGISEGAEKAMTKYLETQKLSDLIKKIK
jgi:Rrf2 family protein